MHIGVARYHDRGHVMAFATKLLEQFKPTHSRQISVHQQARGFPGIESFEKRLAIRIGFDHTAVILQHGAYRLPNEVFIIDDDDCRSA